MENRLTPKTVAPLAEREGAADAAGDSIKSDRRYTSLHS
jgi:hypothetical protein